MMLMNWGTAVDLLEAGEPREALERKEGGVTLGNLNSHGHFRPARKKYTLSLSLLRADTTKYRIAPAS